MSEPSRGRISRFVLPPGGSYILEPEIVLTPDGPQRGCAAAIEDEAFTAVDTVSRVADSRPGLLSTSLPGVAMIPGFVDSHQHPTQTFGKAIIGGQPAQIWKRIWLPLGEEMSAEAIYVAAKWAGIEALRGGFTTMVASGELDEEKSRAVERAIDEVGIRCVLSRRFSDAAHYESPAKDTVTGRSARECLSVAEEVGRAPTVSPRITTSLACDSVQAASPELLHGIAALCGELGLVFQIHANEHTPEVEGSMERYGLRPIELLGSLDALGPQTLIAHATLVTPHEIGLLAERGAIVSYNPVASAWKGNAVAPALEFASAGVRFGLGTDGTRSDGFRLMDAAETAQRLTTGIRVDDWLAGSGRLWLEAATVGGGAAAGLGDQIGAIAPGRRADYLLLDVTAPECLPSWDFVWELVRYYDRTHLLAVYVDGEKLVEGGQPVGWNLAAFIAEHAAMARDIVRRADLILVGDRPDPRQTA